MGDQLFQSKRVARTADFVPRTDSDFSLFDSVLKPTLFDFALFPSIKHKISNRPDASRGTRGFIPKTELSKRGATSLGGEISMTKNAGWVSR